MRYRILWLSGVFVVVFLSMAAAGLAGSATKGVKNADPRFTGGPSDPRSGAAINRDSALNPDASPQPLFPGNPGQFIYSGAVNDPSADTTAQDTQSETTVVPRGANVVTAFNDSGSYNGSNNHFTGFASSLNGGLNWTDHGALPASTNGDLGDPVLAKANDTGNIYLTTLMFSGTGIQFYTSTDGGQTFGPPVNAAPGLPSGDFLDKPWVAVNNEPGAFHDNIAVCFTDFGADGSENIYVTESPDGGTTWFGPTLVNSGGQGCNAVWGNDHSGGGNTLYLTYYQGDGPGGQGGDNKLFMNSYNETGTGPHSPTVTRDGGARAVPAKIHVQVADLNTTTTNGDLQLNGGLRSNSFPQAAVNPVNGRVIVTYNDDPNLADADHGEIYYTTSKDGGATWSAPAIVNDDGAQDQFFPSVALTPDGRKVMFSYYSRADDPNDLMLHRRGRVGTVNLTTGVFSMHSSFRMGPNTPTIIGQDPVINSTYMGDYDQTTADDTFFHNTWSDSRDGNSFHQYQPDVRYARINAASPSADLSVNITPSSATVGVGTTTQLTVNATSTGGVARDVVVNMGPVTGLNYTSVNSTACKIINGFVGCVLGDITDGQTKTFKVNVFAGLPSGTRVVKAQGTTSSRDTTPGNTGTSTLTVTGSGTTDTYSTGNIAVPIPDQGVAEVPLTLPNVGPVLKMQALVRLDHTFDSDLRISLVSPGATKVVTLSNRHGGSGDNYGSGPNDCSGSATPTTFNDTAATPISAGTPPFAGSFQPDVPLANVNGLQSAGTWKLRVEDLAAIDVGTIGCFKLRDTHP